LGKVTKSLIPAERTFSHEPTSRGENFLDCVISGKSTQANEKRGAENNPGNESVPAHLGHEKKNTRFESYVPSPGEKIKTAPKEINEKNHTPFQPSNK